MRYKEYKESGLKWVEKIPSHWEVKRLASVVDIRKEKNDPIKTNEILSLSAKYGVTPYSERKEKGGNRPKSDLSKYNICYKGDILVNSMNVVSGAVGKSNYFGAISPVYYALETNDNNDTDFIEFIFRNYDFQRSMVGLGKGIMMNESDDGVLSTVRMRISWDVMKTLPIPVPPQNEQEKIAKFLKWKVNEIDRLIEFENRKIKLLKKSIKSAHLELILGDSNVENMNFTDNDFLSTIPSDWEIVKLQRILRKIELDADETDDIVICSNHGYSFYRGEQKIGLTSEDNSYYQKVYSGQIMVHGMDTWHGAICISTLNGKCTRVVHVCETNENKEFIVYYLRLLAFLGMYKPYSNGVRQNTSDFRSWKALGNVDIILPPRHIQDEIVDKLNSFISEINQLISNSEERKHLLESLKNSLIVEVVIGQVNILDKQIPKYEILFVDKSDDEDEESNIEDEISDKEEVE